LTFSILVVLKNTMHDISSILLAPTIAVLLVFVAFVAFELGSILVEILTERRRAKFNVEELLKTFQDKETGDITNNINNSQLFKRQKAALTRIIECSDLSPVPRQALARKLLANEELYYTKITNRTDLIARLGPMLGLMATLIPLGPGLIALGQGDTRTLADSLLTAFDATVTGLAAAGVAYAISRVRKRWYEGYLSSLEALMEGLLEVFTDEQRVKE
jgi:biopolymer transport protein ExbB/TolQ